MPEDFAGQIRRRPTKTNARFILIREKEKQKNPSTKANFTIVLLSSNFSSVRIM